MRIIKWLLCSVNHSGDNLFMLALNVLHFLCQAADNKCRPLIFILVRVDLSERIEDEASLVERFG